MTDADLSWTRRLSLAIGAFFTILGDRGFAARVMHLRNGAASAEAQAAPVPAREPAGDNDRPLDNRASGLLCDRALP